MSRPMDDFEDQIGWTRRGRLVTRLDHMGTSGRRTEAEAERLRAATESREFDQAVRDIRLRHAWMKLDAAVAHGGLTREEADGFLEQLRNGQHPRSLRAHLRKLRPGVGSRGY